MSRGSKIIHIPDKKITGSKIKVLEHVIDRGLGTPLKCSKQIPENTGFEENSAQNVSG